jgi:hypothetical protein
VTDVPLPPKDDRDWYDWATEQEDLTDQVRDKTDAEQARDAIAAMLRAAASVTLTYDDAADTLTVDVPAVAAATNVDTAGTIVRRDTNKTVSLGRAYLTASAPQFANEAVRKDYVDAAVAAKAARRLTQKAIGAAYTLVAGDAVDTVLHVTATSAITITLPDDTVAIDTEVAIPWRQYAGGQITFAAGTGATVLSRGSAFKSAGQYAEGVVTKVAASTWLISGDVVA